MVTTMAPARMNMGCCGMRQLIYWDMEFSVGCTTPTRSLVTEGCGGLGSGVGRRSSNREIKGETWGGGDKGKNGLCCVRVKTLCS